MLVEAFHFRQAFCINKGSIFFHFYLDRWVFHDNNDHNNNKMVDKIRSCFLREALGQLNIQFYCSIQAKYFHHFWMLIIFTLTLSIVTTTFVAILNNVKLERFWTLSVDSNRSPAVAFNKTGVLLQNFFGILSFAISWNSGWSWKTVI